MEESRDELEAEVERSRTRIFNRPLVQHMIPEDSIEQSLRAGESQDEDQDAAIGKRSRAQRRLDNYQVDETDLSYAVKRFMVHDEELPMSNDSVIAIDGEDDEAEADPPVEGDGFGPPPRRHAMSTRAMTRFALRAVQGLGGVLGMSFPEVSIE